MKLLLTSSGFSNPSIVNTIWELLGSREKNKLAFIPTAANIEPGEKDWVIADLVNCEQTGFAVDIVDISALPQKIWLPRLEAADVLFFGGGNSAYLMYWLEKSGMSKMLPYLLTSRVYVGSSAGSCVTGPTMKNAVQDLFNEHYEQEVSQGLGLVDFIFIPHYNSPSFPTIRADKLKQAATQVSEPVYTMDKNSAIAVNDQEIQVVAEGEWIKFN